MKEVEKKNGNTINGHEFVDLGLSVLWATCNVGASSPEEYGSYFAWGETRKKESYTIDNCVMWKKEGLGDIAGDSRYDAARANWGGSWRMPTEAEIDELVDVYNCVWKWTTQGGHEGWKVMSRMNGNSIFLPAAGRRYGTSLKDAGEHGGYWSSTPDNAPAADYLYFDSSYYSLSGGSGRGHGRSVRPVADTVAGAKAKAGAKVKAEAEARTKAYAFAKTHGNIAGHDYVDLGLSVKWATCNVGASRPEEYGDYFAWGETKTKSNYTKDNSVTAGKDLGDIAGDSRYDAARANWGGTWRMPTFAEIKELVDNCTWKSTTQGGHKGYRVTSEKNGNSIFLPAAGGRDGTSLCHAGDYGVCRSSTPDWSDTQRACAFFFDLYHPYMVMPYHYCGFPVRPVTN